MISYRQALEVTLSHCAPGPVETVSLLPALDRVLGEPLYAKLDSPRFDQAAVDGYALASASAQGASDAAPVTLTIAGTSAAGGTAGAPLRHGEARLIYTGGPVPPGADAVVMLERAMGQDSLVTVKAPAAPGANIRRRGEEYAAGEALLPVGASMDPAALALAAGQGLTELSVHAMPRVAVISTGDELTPQGTPLPDTGIYDSNGPLLWAALREAGIANPTAQACPDDPGRLKAMLQDALDTHDVVLTAGGVSVGARDFVRPSLAEIGVVEQYWRVAMKPGKPVYFGVREAAGTGFGKKLVFGLPGNPSACLLTYLILVLPALRRLCGLTGPCLPMAKARLATPFSGKRAGRTEWIPVTHAQTEDGAITCEPLRRRGSHMASAPARASGFACLEADQGPLAGDTPVAFLPLSYRLSPPSF